MQATATSAAATRDCVLRKAIFLPSTCSFFNPSRNVAKDHPFYQFLINYSNKISGYLEGKSRQNGQFDLGWVGLTASLAILRVKT